MIAPSSTSASVPVVSCDSHTGPLLDEQLRPYCPAIAGNNAIDLLGLDRQRLVGAAGAIGGPTVEELTTEPDHLPPVRPMSNASVTRPVRAATRCRSDRARRQHGSRHRCRQRDRARLAVALAAEGSDIVVADIDGDDGKRVAAEIAAGGGRALAVAVDVTDAAAVDELADRAESFGDGSVAVVCNNAGVLVWGDATAAVDDWRWVLDVNLLGVVHGVRSFLPRLLAHGRPARIVNTASVAGLHGAATLAAYAASKSAVLSLSESLDQQLDGTNVGVTVLIPGNVESRILDSQRHRSSSRGLRAAEPMGTEPPGVGIDAAHVAEAALAAIRDGDLYAFTYPAEEGKGLRTSISARADTPLRAAAKGAVAR